MGGAEWGPNSLMATLRPQSAAALLAAGVVVEYPSGRVLLQEGEQSTHVLLLLDGYAKLTANSLDGGVALLAIRSSGDLLGELAALDDQPRSATATAAGDVRAKVVAKPAFRDFLLRYPEAAQAVSRSVAAKLRWAIRRRTDFSGCPVRVRIARVLLELAALHGQRTDQGIGMAFPLSQPELAALVGAAEPTVHKALAELRREGVADTRYRSVVIRDRAALRLMAGADAG